MSGNWLGFKWLAYENWILLQQVIPLSPPKPLQPGVNLLCISVPAKSTTSISARAAIKNNTIQISVDASYGAGRAAENKVVAIDFVA